MIKNIKNERTKKMKEQNKISDADDLLISNYIHKYEKNYKI